MNGEMITTDDARDERLALLLAGLIDDRLVGRPADVDRLALENPDLADDLRALWGAAELADGMARARVDDDATADFGGLPSLPRPVGLDPGEKAGQRVGDYVIHEEIGRGGMGVVYRAEHVWSFRTVALKRLIRGASSSADEQSRFWSEVKAAARLTHPNVVDVIDAGTHEGLPFLVMPLVAGTTLAKRLAEGPLPSREAAHILLQVAEAVAHAHDHSVLHRDLKPSNILIDADGRPRVSDFGLAKRVDVGESLTRSGAVLGTPSYMAPEQAVGGRGEVGPRSDVYGLGAVLYQALTGRPPFLAATPLDTILLVIEQDPVPPRALNPSADPDLEMIALKCLQKDPRHRYPTAAALAADLAAYLNGDPVSARTAKVRDLASRLMGETHLAPLMENWGVLWMLHSVALVVFYGLTNLLMLRGVTERWPYVAIFTVGLGAWASLFWQLRKRGGPITFAERLMAHVWAGGVISINGLFVVEWLLGLPVLTLAPVLSLVNGSLFLIKGGFLSGSFYVQALALYLTVFPMARYPRWGPLIFGVVAGACFFVTGLRAQVKRSRSQRQAGMLGQ